MTRAAASSRATLLWVASVSSMLAGCMAFQDVELSTDRVEVAGARPCPPPNDEPYCNQETNEYNVCVDGFWSTNPPCAQACFKGLGCVECIPGEKRCVEAEFQVCSKDGRFVMQSNCAADAEHPLCDAENEGCVECLELESRCDADGETLRSCVKGRFSSTQLCTNAKTKCVAVEANIGVRADYCAECDPGLVRCRDDNRDICGADWRFEKEPLERCGEIGCNDNTSMCNAPAAAP